MKTRSFSSLRLSASLVTGGILLTLCLIPLLAFIYYRVLDSNSWAPTTMDLIIAAYNPSVGLPLLWLLCPLATMAVLIMLWSRKDSVQVIVRQGSPLRIWRSYAGDIVSVSFVAALLLHASLMLLGAVFIGVDSNFDASTSIFSQELTGITLQGFSFAQASLTLFLYCFLVLLLENMTFGVLRWGTQKTTGAFIVLSILNLPQIHGSTSIVYDIMHNLVGGSLAFVNPLSIPYEMSSVSYGTWLPGESHNLWFLLLLVIAVFGIGIWFSKKDYF